LPYRERATLQMPTCQKRSASHHGTRHEGSPSDLYPHRGSHPCKGAGKTAEGVMTYCNSPLNAVKKDGKSLENLVQAIERALAGESVNVECNPKVFGEDGVQLAEFDVVVTGRIGSASVKVLIECRDRPSDGAAPGSWIDQMVGRRSTFQFHKVIAVSTTGFAPAAVLSAQRNDIELRVVETVESFDLEILKGWFVPGSIILQRVNIDHLEVKVFPRVGTTSEMREALKKVITGPKRRSELVYVRQAKRKLSVFDIWDTHSVLAFGNASTWDLSKTKHLRVLCTPDQFDARILTKPGLVFLERIEFMATCSLRVEPIDVTVEHYRSFDLQRPICETLKFQLPTSEGPLEVHIQAIQQINGSALLHLKSGGAGS